MSQMSQFQGSIKFFKAGWGFIDCKETEQLYGKDIFVMQSHLGGDTVQQGDTVVFSVNPEGSKGPEARPGVRVVRRAGLAGGMMGRQTGPQGQYRGIVKNWNPQKGWGMIQCDQTQNMYGKDMFFMKSAVVGGAVIQMGTQVSFNVQVGIKGPEGANVQAFGSMAIAQPFMSPMHFVQLAAAQAQTGRTYFGTIKSFNDEKGWGHISCDGTRNLYGKDMFLLRGALRGQPCAAGDQVRFSVQMGQKGPEAMDVTILPQGTFGIDEALGSTFTGSIKNFDDDKGWGFIQSEEARNLFQKDIFLHKRVLGERTVTAGDEVQFSVTVNKDGKPEAFQVTLAEFPSSPSSAQNQNFLSTGAPPPPHPIAY